jgi:hypothetical protein
MSEEQEIIRIATAVFDREIGGDEQSAQAFLAGLAKLAQQEGMRLVHLGDSLFLVVVKGKGMVEFHTMPANENPEEIAADVVALTKYLRNIGVKIAYTYFSNEKHKDIIDATQLDFVEKQVDAPDGEKYVAYYLEL